MPDHQQIPDAITDTAQSDAMRPQDTTGEAPAAAQIEDDAADPAPPAPPASDDAPLGDQLTEDLSVQGGE